MNVVLDLPRPVEARIEQEAHEAGVSPAELIAEVVKKNFASRDSTVADSFDVEEQKRRNAPTIALLQSWLKRAEIPATPEQIAEAAAEQKEFMRNMNAPRKESGERLLYPDAEKDA